MSLVKFGVFAAICVAQSGIVLGDDYHLKDALILTWNASAWEEGVKPGENDTAIVRDFTYNRQYFEKGQMWSIALEQNEEIETFKFTDLYGLNISGNNVTLKLNKVICEDMSPGPGDTAQVATNRFYMTYLSFKGETNEFYVGVNHVFDLKSGTVNMTEGAPLIKTGPGTMIHSGSAWGAAAAPVWVQEGDYIRTGNGYPGFRGDIIVGGCGKPAQLKVEPTAHTTFMPPANFLDIRPGGTVTLRYAAAAPTIYQERFLIDHGVLDAGGATYYMYNQGATECGPDYALDGGTMTNGVILMTSDNLRIIPSDRSSTLYGTLDFNAKFDVPVPDGPAPVDFLLVGDLRGLNRGIGKAGEGTMVVRCADHVSTWGGIAGRTFDVKAGEFFIESEDTGIGFGTNNVVVAAGATYGGVGRHVGAEDPLRGRQGNVTLNGEAGKVTAFAVGRKNVETGALTPGQYTMGSDAQPNDLTFGVACTLRIAANESAVSRLVVNGTFTLGEDNVLAIEGPEDPAELPSGDHVIVSAIEPLNATFSAVTYNGEPLSRQCGKIVYGENSVVFHVPVRGLSVIVR